MFKLKPFGLERAKQLTRDRWFENYGDYTNTRKAHCKVCGGEISPGKGNQWYYWYGEMKCHHDHLITPNCICGRRYSSHFVCDNCQNELEKVAKEANLPIRGANPIPLL